MKLLRSLMRIAATVCVCMAVIVGITIVVRPRVVRDVPRFFREEFSPTASFFAEPEINLTGSFATATSYKVRAASLPFDAVAPAETNLIRPLDGPNSDWVLADSQPAKATDPPLDEPIVPEADPSIGIDVESNTLPPGLELQLVPDSYRIEAQPRDDSVLIDAAAGVDLKVDAIEPRSIDATTQDAPVISSEPTPNVAANAVAAPPPEPQDDLPSPRIEPSSEGTVYRLDGPRNFTIEVGGKVLLEAPAVESLSGFDSRVVRVTADGPRRITIEALKSGMTAIQVRLAGRIMPPFSVQVQVTGDSYGQSYYPADPNSTAGSVKPTPLVHPSIDGVSEPPQPPASPQPETFEELPAIEPSEVGTVIRLDGSTLRMTADGVQVVESEFRIRRVSGFDPKIIRISALRPTLLKIEALAQGQTCFRVDYDSAALAGLGATGPAKFDVEVGPKLINLQLKTYAPAATTYNAPRATMEAHSATVSPSPRTEAEDTLRELYPKASLQFVWLRDSLVLRGWVDNAGEIPQLIEVAELFAPKVFNQLGVRDASVAASYDDAPNDADASQLVVLTLPGDRGSTLTPRQRVDVIVPRVVQSESGREEVMERKVAENIEVADVQIGPDQVLIHLRVNEETALRLGDIEPARVQVIPHDETAPVPGSKTSNRSVTSVVAFKPEKTLGIWTMGQPVDVVRLGSPEIPMMIVVKNAELMSVHRDLVHIEVTEEQSSVLSPLVNEKLAVIPHSTDGHALHRMREVLGIRMSAVTGKPMALPGTPIAPSAAEATGTEIDAVEPPSSVPESISLSKECRVAITPAGKLDIASCAKCHSDVSQLNLQLNSTDDPLRDEIRSLHDDVRKLIMLLEKRTAVQPSPAEGLRPEAVVWQAMFNEWGRAVLRKDFARALAVADSYVARDPDHHNYKAYAEKARQAISTGNIGHPMLVVAMMRGRACEEVQPLLTRRQNSGLPMVVLNAEAEADAELIQQLKIASFPTLVWTVDGTVLVGHVGVFTEADFNRMFSDAVNTWGRGIGDKNAGELLLPDPQANSPPTEPRGDLNTAPAPPAAAPEAPQAPQSPPESMTDADRPDGVDHERARLLERTWWLVGIRFTPVPENAPQLRERFLHGGLLVDEVRPDSPAAKAKLEAGDVIIGVGKWETTDEQDLAYAVEDSLGEVWEVKFHFVREGRRHSIQVAFESVELEPPPHAATARDEQRNAPEAMTAAGASGLNPQAAARKKLLDEIGRVILRRDYPRALELAETYQAADPKSEFAAIKKIGPENVPVLAVATAKWSAPCQKLQPLLTRLQNDGYGLVILDSDDAADAELIQHLKINAFPTLACVVDGSKKGELVGVFSYTEFDQFFHQFGDMIQQLLDKLESDAGESQPGIEAGIPAATTQSVRESHRDVRATDFNRTFNFSVGFAH